jgi:hypothetical protein
MMRTLHGAGFADLSGYRGNWSETDPGGVIWKTLRGYWIVEMTITLSHST